ncbi:hypothetical protein B7P33_10025 [Sediminicola luteus]|uniref:Uncharacterized protein n=1 Tax=Sediminicola luteus TaxID=319238 RepID=A0A2A4G9G1_9FLAO|nr:hypothetical protein B7P33_10025 [Sediminicola luteus]
MFLGITVTQKTITSPTDEMHITSLSRIIKGLIDKTHTDKNRCFIHFLAFYRKIQGLKPIISKSIAPLSLLCS